MRNYILIFSTLSGDGYLSKKELEILLLNCVDENSMEEEKETNIDIKIIETTMKRLKYQTRKQLSGEEKRKEKRQEERKEEERKEEEKRTGLDEVLSRTEFITGMNYETKHFTETEFNHIMNL